MTDDIKIYQSLLRIAKRHGFDDVKLIENSSVSYIDESNKSNSLYNLAFCKSNKLHYAYLKNQFGHYSMTFYMQGWKRFINEINELPYQSSFKFDIVVDGIDQPLIKFGETFEEAMIRHDLEN